jgi:Domain of unknown function (DUF3819)
VLQKVTIAPVLARFNAKYNLQQMTAVALETALAGINGPVVERAVTIVSTTAFELVTKVRITAFHDREKIVVTWAPAFEFLSWVGGLPPWPGHFNCGSK